MPDRGGDGGLAWQSKAVLLLVLPWTAVYVLLQARWWAAQVPAVAWTTVGISGIFGLVVWRVRAGTSGAAVTGATICASLMFSTTRYPYAWSWLHGGLMPLLAVFLLAWGATRMGRAMKERLGTAESKRGRNAAQVAANLGVAALVAQPVLGLLSGLFSNYNSAQFLALPAIAALAEAAADTVSSELGQVFGGQPVLITTLHRVERGTDGGVTLAGTALGAIAGAVVSGIGVWALVGNRSIFGFWVLCLVTTLGAVFGLLFDSLLGATLERRGWLNNDAVNCLSTASAAAFTMGAFVSLVSRIRV